MKDPALRKIYRISEDIVARDIEGELVIIPITAGIGGENELYALDEIGRDIWSRLDGRKSVAEIVDELEEEYNAAPGVIQKDVLGLLNEISKRGVIIAADPEG